MAKATLATVKSFIRKNRSNLLVAQKSRFDGMVDCVMPTGDKTFAPAQPAEYVHTNNMGIAGVWFVFGSRDSITPFERDGVRGFNVYNCCGECDIAVAIEELNV